MFTIDEYNTKLQVTTYSNYLNKKFETLEEAIEFAKMTWNHLCYNDQKETQYYICNEKNNDVEAEYPEDKD